MHLREGQLEEAAQQSVHRLRAEALRGGGRIRDVAEQNGHLLALALERHLRRENLLGEVPRRVGSRRRESRIDGRSSPDLVTALRAEPGAAGEVGATACTRRGQSPTTTEAEPRLRRVLLLAPGTVHPNPLGDGRTQAVDSPPGLSGGRTLAWAIRRVNTDAPMRTSSTRHGKSDACRGSWVSENGLAMHFVLDTGTARS